MQYPLIIIFFTFYHIIPFFVGMFYVVYDKIVWMSALNTYLKWKRCIWGGRHPWSIILLSHSSLLLKYSSCLSLMLIHGFFFELDQCNSTLYGTSSKLHQHWKQPVVSPLDPRTFTFARTQGSRSLHLTLPKVQCTTLLPLPEASLIPYRREDAECPETHTFIRRRLGH